MKMITVLLPGSHSVATRESNWEIPLRSKGVLEEGGGGITPSPQITNSFTGVNESFF